MRSAHSSVFGFVIVGALLAGCAATESGPQPAPSVNADRPGRLVAAADAAPAADWQITLENIEACSCPTFCQCYFNDRPALHEAGKEGHEHAMRYCRFSNAFRVQDGTYNGTALAGLKFWMAGDLGADFSKGQMDWAVMHFEPSATPQQREAARAICAAIFPVKWNSFTVGADAPIEWQRTPDGCTAKLDDGKAAEIALQTTRGSDGKPVILENVKFWAAPKNGGFEVMTNQTEAYRLGDRAFEYHRSNGFFTRIEMSSKDVKPAQASSSPDVRPVYASGTGTCCRK